jgi:hypothetical protein
MGVNNKPYTADIARLTELLSQDRLRGRFERIGKELGIPPGNIPRMCKRLGITIPDKVTIPLVERARAVRQRKIDKTGFSFHVNQRKREPRWAIWRQAQVRAQVTGREFDLKISDITIPETCPVLGIPLKINAGGRGFKPNSPSLDRIDNNRGYVWDNVIVVSWRANTIKGDATIEELTKVVNFYSALTPQLIRNPIEVYVANKGPAVKLTKEVRLKIIEMNQAKVPKQEIATMFDITISSVNRAIRGAR